MTQVAERVATYVYINDSTSLKVRDIAQSITGLGIVQIHMREDLRKSVFDRPSHIITAGGEGTNLAVTQWMFDIGLVCAVGLLGGGTQNVLYNEISKKGVMTVDEFLRTEVNQFPKENFFRPGQVGEKVIFNNQFGDGAYEKMMGRLLNNANLGFLPRNIRAALSRVTPVLFALYGEPKMNFFSVVEKVGKIPLLPGQDAFAGDLTRVSVETWFDLINSLRLGRKLRKDPDFCIPQDIMRREQRDFFKIEIKGNSIWIDGDTIRGAQMKEHPYNFLKGYQIVKRSDFAFPVVALKTN